MFRFIIGAIISIFMLSLLRMIMTAISGGAGGNGGGGTASKSTAGARGGSQQQQQPPPSVGGGELHKCPVCSTYHTVSNVAGKTPKGEVLLFCSNACREKYSKA